MNDPYESRVFGVGCGWLFDFAFNCEALWAKIVICYSDREQEEITMKQAVMTAPGQIVFCDVERPKPKDNEVLMQTVRIGVCGSDITVYHGLHPLTSFPLVNGHDIGAVVAETRQ